MKLTKQIIVTLIEEVIRESSIDYGGPEYKKGLRDGNRRSILLIKKGEKQSKKGLLRYIDKATENRSRSYKAGYAFAFQLRFSAQLSDPIPDGQLPYANTRERPSWLFQKSRGKNPLAREGKMKPVTGPTLKMYLDPKWGMRYGTAVDKQLRQRKVLIAAARASAIHEQPFPEDQLWDLFRHLDSADKLIDIAKRAYVKAGGQSPLEE